MDLPSINLGLLPTFIQNEILSILTYQDRWNLFVLNKFFNRLIIEFEAQHTNISNRYPTGDLPLRLSRFVTSLFVVMFTDFDLTALEMGEYFPNLKKITRFELIEPVNQVLYELGDFIPNLKWLNVKEVGDFKLVAPALQKLTRLTALELSGDTFPLDSFDELIENLPLTLQRLRLLYDDFPSSHFPKISAKLPKLQRLGLNGIKCIFEEGREEYLGTPFDFLEHLDFIKIDEAELGDVGIIINLFYFPKIKFLYSNYRTYFISDRDHSYAFMIDDFFRGLNEGVLKSPLFPNHIERFNNWQNETDVPMNLDPFFSNFFNLKRLKINITAESTIQLDNLIKLKAPLFDTITHLSLQVSLWPIPASRYMKKPPLQFLNQFTKLFSLTLEFLGPIKLPLVKNEPDKDGTKPLKFYHLRISGNSIQDSNTSFDLASNICQLSDKLEVLDFFMLHDLVEFFYFERDLKTRFPNLRTNGKEHVSKQVYP